MKSKFLLTALFMLMLSSVSYSQSWSDWSTWHSVNCFEGIDFRIKTKKSSYSGNYEAYIEFRNRYNSDVHFNYAATGGEYTTKNNRVTVREGSTYKTYMGASFTSDYFNIFIDKLRHGSDGLQDYSNCD